MAFSNPLEPDITFSPFTSLSSLKPPFTISLSSLLSPMLCFPSSLRANPFLTASLLSHHFHGYSKINTQIKDQLLRPTYFLAGGVFWWSLWSLPHTNSPTANFSFLPFSLYLFLFSLSSLQPLLGLQVLYWIGGESRHPLRCSWF